MMSHVTELHETLRRNWKQEFKDEEVKMKKSRNKEVVEKCLGMIFYVFVQQGQEIETSNKNFLVWKSLGEKKKMRRSSYQILFTSEDSGVEDQVDVAIPNIF